MSADCDVLLVGAGISGLTVAYGLARRALASVSTRRHVVIALPQGSLDQSKQQATCCAAVRRGRVAPGRPRSRVRLIQINRESGRMSTLEMLTGRSEPGMHFESQVVHSTRGMRERPVTDGDLIATDASNLGSEMSLILTRHSVGPKHLRAPGPTEEQLWLAALSALRAPDHEKLIPFRFVLVPQESRSVLAELFADFARREGKSDGEVQIEHDRAMRAPTLLAFVVHIDADHSKVPPHEQWLAAGGALSNFMTALHVMGFGAKMLSGRKVRDPAISASFCGPGEELIGWVAAGTCSKPAHPRHNDNPDAVLQHWRPGDLS